MTSRARAGLGARDRVRLDQYLEHVREIEQRIQRAEQQVTTEIDGAARRRSGFPIRARSTPA